MKRFKSFLALVAILSFAFLAVPAQAQPPTYEATVSVTSSNTVVTPTASLGTPRSIIVMNDGATPIYVRLGGVAVAGGSTSKKINACAGVRFNFDEVPATFLGLITASGTSTAQVTVNYQRGTYPQVPSVNDRIVPLTNPGCTSDTGLTTTNGASFLPYADSELITLSTVALTTDSTGNLLHANSLIDAVVCRQTTAITVSTNWGISDPTTANRFAAGVAIANTTLVGLAQNDPQGAGTANGPVQAAAAKLRITVTGANAGAGVVRCTVFGRTAVVPAS